MNEEFYENIVNYLDFMEYMNYRIRLANMEWKDLLEEAHSSNRRMRK